MQYSQRAGCLRSENSLEANFKIPGREEGLSTYLESSEQTGVPAVGVKIQQPSMGRAPLPFISWEINLAHFNYQLCSVAGHTQESKDVVSMVTLLL